MALQTDSDAPTPTPTAPAADLPVALVAQPGGGAAMADGQGAWSLASGEARTLFQRSPVVIAHAALTARRLSLPIPARKPDLLDALELYAFVRPASFCAPSAVGLARALGLAEPKGPVEQAQTLREAALALLEEQHVAVVQGSAFRMSPYVRISYATDEAIGNPRSPARARSDLSCTVFFDRNI